MSEVQVREVAFSEVLRDVRNGTKEPRQYVFTRREDYEAWFEEGSRRYPPDAAEVDFSREAVLLVSSGRKPTTGYGIEVVRVVDLSSVLGAPVTCVLYRETAPSPKDAVGDALTYPVHMVKVPQAETQYVFARA